MIVGRAIRLTKRMSAMPKSTPTIPVKLRKLATKIINISLGKAQIVYKRFLAILAWVLAIVPP